MRSRYRVIGIGRSTVYVSTANKDTGEPIYGRIYSREKYNRFIRLQMTAKELLYTEIK